MKLSISNIAWNKAEETRVADLMKEMGVTGVEIAPSKIFEKLPEPDPKTVRAYRDFWEKRGIRIVATQSLLFGRSDLTIFENETKRAETGDYLRKMVGLAADLGAEILVFGSPKNRARGGVSPEESMRIAAPFFKGIGDYSEARGVTFCIEPNPSSYGCDFVTKTDEGINLVKRAGTAGFGLNLDAGGMTMAGEKLPKAIAAGFPYLRHFHVSAEHLGPVGTQSKVDYTSAFATLNQMGYRGWYSIEMKNTEGDNMVQVRDALEFVRKALKVPSRLPAAA